MVLTWQGDSFFKIQTKDTLIFTNPTEKGLKRFRFDILVNSQFKNYKDIKDKVFIVNSPGEYDIKNVFIKGILLENSSIGNYNKKEDLVIYNIDVEDIRICHLFNLKRENLTNSELDLIGSVDILIIPVGDKTVLGAKSAYDLVNKIEPKIIIPIYYKIPKISSGFDSLENFSNFFSKKQKKEVGKKFILKKKDLPEKEFYLIILEPNF